MQIKNKIIGLMGFLILCTIAYAQETISVGVRKIEEFSTAAIAALVLIAVALIILIIYLIRHFTKEKTEAKEEAAEEGVPAGKKILKVEEAPEEIEEIKKKIEEHRGFEIESYKPFHPKEKSPLKFDEADHFSEESKIERHLKDDEKTIINILKMKHGQCSQGTLRVITGFPKATLSRILMEMEARGFIHKESVGKKNMVYLKNI